MLDSVDGDEESTYGSLTETYDHKLNRLIGEYELEVNGNYTVTGGEEVMMITGAFAETEAGGQFFAGGMSDALMGGAGFRLTLVGDLWIAGLVGMEEKIATGIADGIVAEISRLTFEREYVTSNYNGMFAYQNASVTHTTTATSFLPMFKTVRGLRNQLPGSGAAEGEGDEPSQATPPPAAGQEAGEAADAADGGARAGAGAADGADGGGEIADITRATESTTGAADGAADGTRMADTSADAARSTDGLLEGMGGVDEAGQLGNVNTMNRSLRFSGELASSSDLATQAKQSIARGEDLTEAQTTAFATRWVDELLDTAAESADAERTPQFGPNGLCTDQGIFFGWNEETVRFWQAEFEAKGDKIEFVNGRWQRTQQGTRSTGSFGWTGETSRISRSSPETEFDRLWGGVGRQTTVAATDNVVTTAADGSTVGSTTTVATTATGAGDTAADMTRTADIAADTTQTAPITGADDTGIVIRHPTFENDVCMDEGPYFGKSRAKVEKDRIYYQRQGMLLEWKDGQWHQSGTFNIPQFNRKGICTDEGPFKGVPRDQVWGAKDYFESHGRRVEWGRNEAGYTWVYTADDTSMYDNVDELEFVAETGTTGRLWRSGGSVNPSPQTGGVQGAGLSPPARLNIVAADPPVSAPSHFKWHRPPFRHPKTARRLNKMSELSKANRQASLTAAAHHAFQEKVLSGSSASRSKSMQDHARNSESVQAAFSRLGETVEASSESTSSNWWKVSEDMGGGQDVASDSADGRHLVDQSDDLHWTSHLDRFYRAVKRPQDTAATTADASKVSRRSNVPVDQGVFGVVNPALNPGQPIADVPAAAPVVGGTEGYHLLPRGNAAEQVSAPSVMRAVDSMEAKVAPTQRAVVRAEETAAAKRMQNILKRQITTLRRTRRNAEGATRAALTKQLVKAQNTLAALEASLSEAHKADAVDVAAGVKPQAVGEITDTARSGVRTGSEDGLAKSTWQASESASSGGAASPQMSGVGAQWKDSPPKNINVDRTIVVQGADGSVHMETVASGGAYDSSSWLDELSSAAPPPGMATGGGFRAGVPDPTRLQKIQSWFSDKAAQIYQFFRRSGSGVQSVEDFSSGGRFSDSATDTEAVLDNIPGREVDRGSDAADEVDNSGVAKSWQADLEAGAPGNPGPDDLLRQPPEDSRGLDTNLELVEGDVAAKTGGDGKVSDSAGAGVRPSGGQAPLPESKSGANYDDYIRFHGTRTEIRRKARDYEQDSTLRQIGTINDVRNWYDDELSKRLVSMAQQVDPSHTKESLLRGESLGRWNLEADIILDSIYKLNKKAVQDGDPAAAHGYAEIIRRGADYLEEVNRVASAREMETTVAEPAPYRANRVLEMILADADYLAAKEANFAPLEEVSPDMIRLRVERTIEYSAWDIAVRFLRNQEDARAPLYRYMDRANYSQMANTGTTDTYAKVIGRINEYVAQACNEVGMRSPPINREGRLFSAFTETDKADLLKFFDQVDAGGDLVAPSGRLEGAVARTFGDSDASAPLLRVARATDSEGVKYGVSPEFPTVTVRGAQAEGTVADTATAGGVANAGKGAQFLDPAAGPVRGALSKRPASGKKKRVRFAEQPTGIAVLGDMRAVHNNVPVIYLDSGSRSPIYENLRGLGQSQVGTAGQPGQRSRGILKSIANPVSQTQFLPTRRSARTRPWLSSAPRAAGSGTPAAGRGGMGGLALFQFETGGLRAGGNESMYVRDYMKGTGL